MLSIEILKILLDKTTYNKKYKVTSKTKRDLFEKREVKMSNEFRKLLVREKRQGMVEAFVEMIKDKIITVADAAKRMGMTEKEFSKIAGLC